MEVANHIDFDGCINLTTGWKEFVAESGFEDGDVTMVMFSREDDSLTSEFMCCRFKCGK